MNAVNCVAQIPVTFEDNDNQVHKMMALEEIYPPLNVNNIKVITDYKFLQNINIDNYSEYICNLKVEDMTYQENNINGNYHLVPNIPLNLMPPPPHNVTNNNFTVHNFNKKASCRCKGELRSNSPNGSESDESCRSYTSRESPAEIKRKLSLSIYRTALKLYYHRSQSKLYKRQSFAIS